MRSGFQYAYMNNIKSLSKSQSLLNEVRFPMIKDEAYPDFVKSQSLLNEVRFPINQSGKDFD